MTKLGHGGPFARVRDVARGLVHRERRVVGERRAIDVIGHRGAPTLAAENTRASFLCALDRGANAVEADVCVTRDGVFVLFHDPDPREHITVARDLGEGLLYVANEPAIGSPCRKPIVELTYDEFRTHFGYTRRRDPVSHVLDGNTTPEVQPEPLDVLLALDDRRLTDIYLDLKLRPGDAAAIEALVTRVAGDPRVHLLSTEVEVVEQLLALGADVYGDFELPGVVAIARELGLRQVAMGAGQRTDAAFDAELLEVLAAREAGELDRVVVWTFNDERALARLVELGVDGVITDEAALLRRLL